MKTFQTLKKLGIGLILMLGVKNSTATSIMLYPISDSTSSTCPTPVNYFLYFQGQCSGYTPGVDDMDIFVDYGDGTTNTFSVPISGNFTTGWFNANDNHSYTLSGLYTITVIATGTDGNADTITKGPVYVSTACGVAEGHLYFDHNNNCVYDAGDNPVPNHQVWIYDPVTGVFQASDYSDVNGYYSMSIPIGFNFEIACSLFAVSGAQVTCPASCSYSFLSAATNTHNFGVQTSNTINLNYSFDSTAGACSGILGLSMNMYGNSSGYNNLTDSMDIDVYFGDGNDTSFVLPLGGLGSFSSPLTHIYYTPGLFTIMIVATAPDGLADTLYTTAVVVGNGCGTVEGDLYLDNNSNCVFDAGDDPVYNMNVVVTDPVSGSIITIGYSDQNGHYVVSVPSGLNLEIAANAITNTFPMPGLVFICPLSGSYSFTSTTGTTNYNFAMNCSASQFDLSVNLWGSALIPGDTVQVIASACNSSCNAVTGTLTVTLDPSVQFAGMYPGYPAPASVVGNTITWNFTNLGLIYSNWSCQQFVFYILVDTTVVMGDTLCFSAEAQPFTGDSYLPNNTVSSCKPAFSSFDPNMKEVMPVGDGPLGLVAPHTTFTYMVHFQNTGTFYAEDIYIIDTLSANLDVSTFEILGSSHTMQPTVYSDNRVRFNFPNIMLIDSTTDEPNSHGWVWYRITTKNGLTDGAEIKNTAHIYFDYNAPVATNTTLNAISITSIEEITSSVKNEIYPNPTSNVINVRFEEHVNSAVQVRDVTGRIVYDGFIKNSNLFTIDVANWNAGVYELSLNGTELTTTRFVVIR